MEGALNKLRSVDNRWSRAVDFWFKSIKEGYIVEFTIEYNNSFSVAERKLTKGPRGRYLELLPLWIKKLLCDKGMMSLQSDSMAK